MEEDALGRVVAREARKRSFQGPLQKKQVPTAIHFRPRRPIWTCEPQNQGNQTTLSEVLALATVLVKATM